ncbi:8907_t:CDS:2, partial [Gigaspora margarita]
KFVYNSLISLENTNNFYEDDNTKLVISFDIELSSFINIILDKDDKENFDNNEKLYLEVAHYTAKSIEEATTLEIREFIKSNINYLVLELHRQIREKQLKGYKNLTVQQAYFWWSKEFQKVSLNPDPFISTKPLLTELNQKIIIDITVSIPALEFLTVLFYQLLRNNFDAVQIDATYRTNKMG